MSRNRSTTSLNAIVFMQLVSGCTQRTCKQGLHA